MKTRKAKTSVTKAPASWAIHAMNLDVAWKDGQHGPVLDRGSVSCPCGWSCYWSLDRFVLSTPGQPDTYHYYDAFYSSAEFIAALTGEWMQHMNGAKETTNR